MKKLNNRNDANVHQANLDIGLVESFSQRIVLGQEIPFVVILEHEIVRMWHYDINLHKF